MGGGGPVLDIDLGALVRNARAYGARTGLPLLPMVKADGYGTGAVAAARALAALGPAGFGVATPAEAGALRAAGIDRPIIAFQPMPPDAVDAYLAVRAEPVIGSLAALAAWTARSAAPFQVEIDTGMGRSGFRWHDAEAIGELGRRLAGAAGFAGVFTHFSSADTSESATREEWDRFAAVLAALPTRPRWVHGPNSAGGQWGPFAGATLARPGIFLYGGRAGGLTPEPVATLRAPVVAIRRVRPGDDVGYGRTWQADRPADLATLAIGYADGVRRTLSSRGEVTIGGRRWPIAGRVTMDMTVVAADPGAVSVGDRAVLFGADPTIDEVADRAGTISYELLTAVGSRVARRYREDG